MEISTTRVAAYVGAGAAVGGGFAALRVGGSPKGIALGVGTGLLASGVQSLVHAKTGSSEAGWGAAIGAGAVAGALLLPSLAPATLRPIAARGVGAAIGGVTGLIAPVVAGVVLAQLE